MTGVTRLVTLFVSEIINIFTAIISDTTTTTTTTTTTSIIIIVSRQVADMKPEIRNNLQVVFSYNLTLETKSLIRRVQNIWLREDFNMKKMRHLLLPPTPELLEIDLSHSTPLFMYHELYIFPRLKASQSVTEMPSM